MSEQRYCIWVFLDEEQEWANTSPSGETDLDLLEKTVQFGQHYNPGREYQILPIEENPNDR